MTVEELIEELKKYGMDKKTIVFAEGKLFPILEIGLFDDDDRIEICCGWKDLEE